MALETSSIPNATSFLKKHAPLLEKLYAKSGAARWDLSEKEFAEALARSVARHFPGGFPAEADLEEYCSALYLSDLALACALRHGSTAAWEEFVSSYRPLLYASARAIVGSAGEARAREVADSLYAELYGVNRNDGKRPLLEYFHGRSKLSTWLRTILAQRHIDALRSSKKSEFLDPNKKHERASHSNSPDPDRARLLPYFQAALASAMAAMSAADRLLLGLYYVQGMKLAQIAKLQKLHEATISRQLDRIRGDLPERIERLLLQGQP